MLIREFKKQEITEQDMSLVRELFFNQIQTRDDIIKLGEYVENHPDNLGKDPFPLFHRFADGMYTREMHVPKGALIVGAIHKNAYHINVIKGKLWVVNEFEAKEIEAPFSFTARAGVKNIGYVLEDLVWVDTSRTDKTTVEEAEKDIFADTYEELDEYLGICATIQQESGEKLCQQ